ncbi:uncharacterized protein BX663DRAFT_546135, partial [Cokeromyces recurvatus]|uniref:uncharacterized protein n=1 Tax=Cokeromyces recurvatus TaxID=90255 RepID=UPI0022205C00
MVIHPHEWDFTHTQWRGLVNAGVVASAVSFAANSCVLLIHGIISYYRHAIVNRLSLRMIALSCVFNMIYCACQLATDNTAAISHNCYVMTFVLVSSDAMACMCLTMVGLNLVMIFVLKTARSLKIEICYYILIAVVGILVSTIPYIYGPKPIPQENFDEHISCWYYFYFDGRMTRVFNWLWYYSWLLFSLGIAALCTAISIRFVIKKQKNFNGALDIFTQRKRNTNEISTAAIIKKYAANNTNIFQKIALRCIFYPLVPLISKSWGVGIEIAAAREAYIPYVIFVFDRVFSCLLGFLFKIRYVHDYFCLQYQPDPNFKAMSQYPCILKATPLLHHSNSISKFMQAVNHTYFGHDLDNEQNTFHKEDRSATSLRSSQEIVIHRTSESSQPEQGVPIMSLQQKNNSGEITHYNIIYVVSIDGKAFSPNENKDNRHLLTSIPMRRVSSSSMD